MNEIETILNNEEKFPSGSENLNMTVLQFSKYLEVGWLINTIINQLVIIYIFSHIYMDQYSLILVPFLDFLYI